MAKSRNSCLTAHVPAKKNNHIVLEGYIPTHEQWTTKH